MFILISTLAFGALPPPSYEDALVYQQTQKMNHIMDLADRASTPSERQEYWEQSVRMSRDFQSVVVKSAAVERLECIALQQLNKTREALRSCLDATTLPLHGLASWSPDYQLSMLYEQAQQYEEALIVLKRCTVSMDNANTEIQWVQIAHARLAKLAALQEDSVLLEKSLKTALQAGFRLDELACDPEWQTLYKDKGNRTVLNKLLSVYSEPRSLSRLQGSEACL